MSEHKDSVIQWARQLPNMAHFNGDIPPFTVTSYRPQCSTVKDGQRQTWETRATAIEVQNDYHPFFSRLLADVEFASTDSSELHFVDASYRYATSKLRRAYQTAIFRQQEYLRTHRVVTLHGIHSDYITDVRSLSHPIDSGIEGIYRTANTDKVGKWTMVCSTTIPAATLDALDTILRSVPTRFNTAPSRTRPTAERYATAAATAWVSQTQTASVSRPRPTRTNAWHRPLRTQATTPPTTAPAPASATDSALLARLDTLEAKVKAAETRAAQAEAKAQAAEAKAKAAEAKAIAAETTAKTAKATAESVRTDFESVTTAQESLRTTQQKFEANMQRFDNCRHIFKKADSLQARFDEITAQRHEFQTTHLSRVSEVENNVSTLTTTTHDDFDLIFEILTQLQISIHNAEDPPRPKSRGRSHSKKRKKSRKIASDMESSPPDDSMSPDRS